MMQNTFFVYFKFSERYCTLSDQTMDVFILFKKKNVISQFFAKIIGTEWLICRRPILHKLHQYPKSTVTSLSNNATHISLRSFCDKILRGNFLYSTGCIFHRDNVLIRTYNILKHIIFPCNAVFFIKLCKINFLCKSFSQKFPSFQSPGIATKQVLAQVLVTCLSQKISLYRKFDIILTN